MPRLCAEPRAGHTLVELLTVLAVGSLLATVLLGLLIAQLRLARAVADRAVAAEAVRTAAVVLSGEVARARPADVRGVSHDSLALRAFRGSGIVCAALPTALRVRYRGDRLPDARKDSVLLLSDGSARAAALLDVRTAPAGACAARPGEELIELQIAPPGNDASIVLVFESGTYFLSARALRYRLGAEGRQPLTTETFVPARTRFSPDADDALRFELAAPAADARSFTAVFAPR